ncbi:MAG: hypothetical protein LBD70_03330 [Bifidobacteriaceae bacterium]|jgi:hypothetical protein|nr:hypothetical protein [Bifidobacteriaceae bacterium]
MRRTKGRLAKSARALAYGAAAMLAALTGIAAAQSMAPAAHAAGTVTFTVNSAELIVEGASCSTEGGVCTLRQALTEANQVEPLETEVFIDVDPEVSGTIPFPKKPAELMYQATTAGLDSSGAVFQVSRPMTIDLRNNLHLVPPDSIGTGLGYLTGIWVDAANVHLKNFTDWYSTATAILFSGNAHGSSLDGGVSIQTENDHTNRQVAIWAPARDVTISNYTTGRQPGAEYDGGIVLDTSSSKYSLTNITIANVTFDSATVDGGKCGSTDATGCSGQGIVVMSDVKVDHLVVEHCLFANFAGDEQAIDASAAGEPSNWDIHHNTFRDMTIEKAIDKSQGETHVVVQLPTDEDFAALSRIHHNLFDNSSEQSRGMQGLAIYMDGTHGADSVSLSNLFIEDNHFDGYRAPIRLWGSGTVTVRRNTFGQHTGSQTKTEDEESEGSGLNAYTELMFNNFNNTANRKIRTWYPTSATVVGCALSVDVAPPTSGTAPNTPVTVDVYWTAGATAEVYLGGVSLGQDVTTATTITLDQLPPEAGYIRLQTLGTSQDPDQMESSQYSRTVAVDAPPACQPALAIDLRAWAEVPAAATTHDQIVAPDSGARELPDAAAVQSGEPVWFTYTVRNTGPVVLRDVVVRDGSGPDPVCVIDLIPIGGQAGCVRQETA